MKSELSSSFKTAQQYRHWSDEAQFCYTKVAHKYVKQDCISVQLREPRTRLHLQHYSLPCPAGDPDARMQECLEQSRGQSSKATSSDTRKLESVRNVKNLSERCVRTFVASVRIS